MSSRFTVTDIYWINNHFVPCFDWIIPNYNKMMQNVQNCTPPLHMYPSIWVVLLEKRWHQWRVVHLVKPTSLYWSNFYGYSRYTSHCYSSRMCKTIIKSDHNYWCSIPFSSVINNLQKTAVLKCLKQRIGFSLKGSREMPCLPWNHFCKLSHAAKLNWQWIEKKKNILELKKLR